MIKLLRCRVRKLWPWVAAGLVAGRPGDGPVWRRDLPERRGLYGDSFLPCPGSSRIVDLPLPVGWLELTDEEMEDVGDVDVQKRKEFYSPSQGIATYGPYGRRG